jgi:hypothetical protein
MNTRSRHFYTDPLAAAWMAKHFGMEFENTSEWDGEFDLGFFEVSPYGDEISSGIDVGIKDKYFIHPDSLHLLDPKAGDLVDGIRIGTVFEVNGNELSVDVHGGDWEMDADRVTILQRDGKPFFWPEVEA